MLIGVPTEIKPDELRVAIMPAGVRDLVAAGQLTNPAVAEAQNRTYVAVEEAIAA